MNRLPHLAQRWFNTPLAIHPRKAEVAIHAIGSRFGITRFQMQDSGGVVVIQPQALSGEWQGANRAGYEIVGGIALIAIEGTLVQKLGSLEPYSGMTGYDGIRQNFVSALHDPEVQAIAFLIDSPGGEVAGAFDLSDLIFEARGEKPIWSILDENAFSAGYAIASAADRIIVPRTGGTGSVGVITLHVDMSQALAAAGLKVTFLYYGQSKTDGWAELPLSEDAKARYQADINAMGDLFVETVARNRGMTTAAVKATEARTYQGQKGVEIGFTDAVMSPAQAFQSLLATL